MATLGQNIKELGAGPMPVLMKLHLETAVAIIENMSYFGRIIQRTYSFLVLFYFLE